MYLKVKNKEMKIVDLEILEGAVADMMTRIMSLTLILKMIRKKISVMEDIRRTILI